MGYMMTDKVSKHQDSHLEQKQLWGIYKEYILKKKEEYILPYKIVGYLLGI